jgi:hypothetical protein
MFASCRLASFPVLPLQCLTFLPLPLAIPKVRAAEPTVTFQQITVGPKNHFFGYIGHCLTIPWNQTGRFIVALRTDFHDRMPRKGELADVVLIDSQKENTVRVLDRTRAWNLQQGSMLYWNPLHAESQFFFNDVDPESGAGQVPTRSTVSGTTTKNLESMPGSTRTATGQACSGKCGALNAR